MKHRLPDGLIDQVPERVIRWICGRADPIGDKDNHNVVAVVGNVVASPA